MARRLRIQFPGARYHVINRGNLQHDVFATTGARDSFSDTLGETVERFNWRLSAFMIMRNHYHLALETPDPNLVEGMHWLQSTFAIRLTRFHNQHGHVFQGRYKALLVEDAWHHGRVCDYIHLNPVRAGVVPAAEVGDYRSGSLWRWINGKAGAWLDCRELLDGLQIDAAADPWPKYVGHLIDVAATCDDDRNRGGAYSQGWAIGTAGWRKAIAREYSHLALAPEMTATELYELKSARWQQALEAALQKAGKSLRDAEHSPKGIDWKVTIARSLRTSVVAPYPWIAAKLKMGKPASVRVYLSQQN